MRTDQRARRRSSVLPACMAAAFCCIAMSTPVAGGTVGLAQLPGHWRGDDGRDVELTRFEGHRVVLTMAYATCHRICPMTIAALKSIQQRLDGRGEVAEFVIVGYDPANDDAAAWHRYRMTRNLTRSNWHFVTGTNDATVELAKTLGFDFWKYDDHVMHDSRVVVFDSRGILQRTLGPETPDWSAAL